MKTAPDADGTEDGPERPSSGGGGALWEKAQKLMDFSSSRRASSDFDDVQVFPRALSTLEAGASSDCDEGAPTARDPGSDVDGQLILDVVAGRLPSLVLVGVPLSVRQVDTLADAIGRGGGWGRVRRRWRKDRNATDRVPAARSRAGADDRDRNDSVGNGDGDDAPSSSSFSGDSANWAWAPWATGDPDADVLAAEEAENAAELLAAVSSPGSPRVNPAVSLPVPLTTLVLVSCGLGDAHAAALAAGLASPPGVASVHRAARLASLDVSCNAVGCRGAALLFAALARHGGVERVCVRANRIGPRGLRAAGLAMRGAPWPRWRLRTLDLGCNPAGGGVAAWADLCTRRDGEAPPAAGLERLALDGVDPLGAAEADSLLWAAEGGAFPRLRHLTLTGCPGLRQPPGDASLAALRRWGEGAKCAVAAAAGAEDIVPWPGTVLPGEDEVIVGVWGGGDLGKEGSDAVEDPVAPGVPLALTARHEAAVAGQLWRGDPIDGPDDRITSVRSGEFEGGCGGPCAAGLPLLPPPPASKWPRPARR